MDLWENNVLEINDPNNPKLFFITKFINEDLSNIINSIPIEYDNSDSYKYWIREKYPLDRSWIYFQDIFKKAKVNR